MTRESYKKSNVKSAVCKIDMNYFANAQNMIYKKEAEKSAIEKEKTHRNVNFYG